MGHELRAAEVGRLVELDAERVRELIARHGFVVFKEFDATRGAFEEFTDKLAPCDPTLEVRVPSGGLNLGHHAEDAYNPYRPDVLWLLCVNPGDLGGAATIVADGVATFADMGADWQRFCQERRLRFGRLWSSEAWTTTLGSDQRAALAATLESIPDLTFEFLGDGALYVSYETPFVVRTHAGEASFANSLFHAVNYPKHYGVSLDDGSPVPDALLSHVREVVARHEASVDWNAGDFLAIDNYRTMHRRPPYSGQHRVLCRRNCRSFYGRSQVDASSPVGAWVKGLLNMEFDDPVYVPTRSGQIDDSWRTADVG